MHGALSGRRSVGLVAPVLLFWPLLLLLRWVLLVVTLRCLMLYGRIDGVGVASRNPEGRHAVLEYRPTRSVVHLGSMVSHQEGTRPLGRRNHIEIRTMARRAALGSRRNCEVAGSQAKSCARIRCGTSAASG